MKGYISVREAPEQWNVTERQVQRMCSAGMTDGVIRLGNSWAIPEDSPKPARTGKLKPGRKPKSSEVIF